MQSIAFEYFFLIVGRNVQRFDRAYRFPDAVTVDTAQWCTGAKYQVVGAEK
jgi:hypothetical protein